ncbi:MAG: hypothetical protein LBU32_23265 [Clostridiales bacterium]|nr:hypothetical protein [Clostridiales bacterium]
MRRFHRLYAGKLKLNLKRGQSFRDVAFMGIMRRAFYNGLKEKHPDAGTACGYTAKNTRIRNSLEKDHAAGARCAGGNPLAVPLDVVYMRKAVNVKHFFPGCGKHFFLGYGKEFFPGYGKHFFPSTASTFFRGMVSTFFRGTVSTFFGTVPTVYYIIYQSKEHEILAEKFKS